MKKFVLVIALIATGLLIILLVLPSDNSNYYNRPSYFVWADKTINVYDRKNDTKKTYEFDEYNCRDIGKYYGGDFCCIGEKNNIEYVLLFKDGVIENYISLPYEAEQIVAWHNDIIFFSDGKIYIINKRSQEFKLLIDNVADRYFYINENGDIAFLRNTNEENDYAEVFALYIYSDNKEEYIGNVDSVFYWQSNEEIVVRTYAGIYHHHYEFSDYIINVQTKTWEKTKLFKKAASIVSWKQGSTAIGWSYMTGKMESQYSGMVNIESKHPFSSAFTVETMDLINDIGFFEWYEENPMEKETQGTA